MKQLKLVYELLKETVLGYGRDKGGLLAAALAYHTIFSLAPLLVIAVAVAGFFFGEAAVTGELVGQIEGAVGQETAVIIQNLIRNARESASGIVATLISSALLIWGASGIFNQLKTALNLMWGIAPPPGQGFVGVVKVRVTAVVMVMGIGFLLLVVLLSNALLAALDEQLLAWWPAIGGALPALSYIVTFALSTLLFAIIYKTLPDAIVSWRDVLAGGAFTSLLFGIGQWIVGQYLSGSSVGAAYGAASSLVVLLFWIFVSAQILMIGAEFTQAFANRHGDGVVPVENALILRREAVEEEVVHVEPEPVPIPLTLTPEPAAGRWRAPVATGLFGLAAGLLLGFVGSLMRDR